MYNFVKKNGFKIKYFIPLSGNQTHNCLTHNPAHRVGRGNLVLRLSVPHFPLSSGGIACRVAELNAVSTTTL